MVNLSEEEKIVDRVSMIDQWKTSGDIYTQDELNAIGELLDLYYKQQKEIEALKLIHETYKEVINKGEFITKDKIKNKIKEINETYEELEEDELGRKEYYYPGYTIDILEELLKEE